MNAKDAGVCHIRNDRAYKDIPTDKNGNHILTGEGMGKDNLSKRFTCTKLEVYKVSY